MKSAPTDRHRAMAKRRSDGMTLDAVALEFATDVPRVQRAVKRVEDYERGIALLRADPLSIEGLALVGVVPLLARRTLAEQGILRLTDLQRFTPEDLLRFPSIRERVITQLLGLLQELRAT